MSDLLERLNNLSPNRLALLVMDLQERLEATRQRQSEPVAIIGMACRFPGADTPEAFWELLRNGVDAIREIPGDRFDVDALFDPDPEAVGKIATRWGGFLEHIDEFDATLFGIAPREAAGMDPQQRLLLETAWEAIERAGYAPDGLRGSRTGVFAGLCNSDHAQMLLGGDRKLVDAYTATGNAHSVAAGRISYALGLQGPSIAVDTACSSSLVAIHLAIQSLRAGECQMALAGGSNVILSPDTTITLSRARMMAPDGRCKAFDASADGFVRSEGCGVVLLKRLADAEADGDPVLAVIRGSALNQDGRSNGITAPNGPSQESVIRAALADAGLAADVIQYVEAHGTGTALGDPIEARALGSTFGERGEAGPLLVGSVKTNLGHLESAAGVAGLMKVVLMLQHGEIAPNLHFEAPSPHIPWDEMPLRIPAAVEPWPETPEHRRAGLSSFGFSGTNAHLIIEAAPEVDTPATGVERPQQIVKLSAMDDEALRQLAGRYADSLSTPGAPPFADFAHTANVARSDLLTRATVVAASAVEARDALESLSRGETPDNVTLGTAGPRPPAPVFLFTGQGAQYPEMGKDLYQSEPVFRSTLDRCAELLEPYLGRSILEIMFAGPDSPDSALLDETRYTQPALFAIEYALAMLWQSWGVRPAAVAGHSLGEFAAACVAGILSLEDALRLVAARGRLMGTLPPGGEMAAVFASEERVGAVLGSLSNDVALAAINGPESVTLSGAADSVKQAVERLHLAGIEARLLRIPLAAHSPLVDPILDAFEAEAAATRFNPPQIDFICGLNGQLVQGAEIDARYWRDQLREPVRFADSIGTLLTRGHTVFVESGPHPVLVGMARQFVPEGVTGVASLRRGHDAWETILGGLGALYVAGGNVDWHAFDRPYDARRVILPTYPFQRVRHWHAALSSRRDRDRYNDPANLLGKPVLSPVLAEMVFETHLGPGRQEFLHDHRIHGVPVLPSPVYLEMLRVAAASALNFPPAISHFEIHEALVLPDSGERIVQSVLSPSATGMSARIYSRSAQDDRWTLHAGAELLADDATSPAGASVDLTALRDSFDERLDAGEFYAGLAGLGLEFGPAFRGLRDIYRRDGEALGRLVLPDTLAHEATSYQLHPALLDACFHLLGAALHDAQRDNTWLLIAIERFRLHKPAGMVVWNHTSLRNISSNGAEVVAGDVQLYDEAGDLVAEARGVQLKLATPEALARAVRRQIADLYYEVDWQPAPLAETRDTPKVRPSVLAGRVGALLEPLAKEHGLAMYADVLPLLERLSTSYVVRALGDLDVTFQPGEKVVVTGVLPRHRRLVARLLEMLVEDGVLRDDGATHVVLRAPETVADPDTFVTELLERFPEAEAEITLTARCGEQLADVLRGEVDPLHLLFPDGSFAALEQLYRHSPFARVFNGLVGAAVADIVAASPAGRTLRVLEVGAGTGATTDAMLGALPADRIEYWFTDISPLFLERAEARLSGLPGLRYALFDVEREPAGQEIPTGAFDLVIAANVLHATADLRSTLASVSSLLVPGGTLLLLEGTQPRRWVDLTFGLTEGWWRFTDTSVRPGYPLLSGDAWADLLAEAGFSDPAPVAYEAGNPVDQALILASSPAAEWLLVPDGSGIASALAEHLRARGERVRVVDSASDIVPDGSTPMRVVHLAGVDAPAAAASAEDQLATGTALCAEVVDIVRSLATGVEPAGLWIVTRGAQPLTGGVVSPLAATLWGLGRVITLEHPEITGGLVDLDPAYDSARAAGLLLAELDAADGEDQVALRGEQRFIPRLVARDTPSTDGHTLSDDASYLLAGGTGGLGLKLAHRLVADGVRHLVLTSRNPDNERTAQLKRVLEGTAGPGVRVHVLAVDVADRAQMTALFSRFGDDLPPLKGIVHAAAHLDPFLLRDLGVDALESMLRPKLTGTLLLHELSHDLELDFFVLFSSTTALWGSSHLGHYAAANTFLDAFAHWRRAMGLPALSINWGTWDEMRVASEDERRMVAGYGLNPLPSEDALDAFTNLLGSDLAQIVVADVDWQRLKAAYESRRPRPFLAQVGEQQPPVRVHPNAASVPTPGLLSRLETARPDERRDLVAAFIQTEVARTLGTPPGNAIDPQQGLFQLGMDSLMAVDLKGRLEGGAGHPLPTTVVFNHPTIDALTDYLLDELEDVSPVEPAEHESVYEQPAADTGVDNVDLDALSEDELEQLLAERLARAALVSPGGARQ